MKTHFHAVFSLIVLVGFIPVPGVAQGLGQANTTVSTNPYAQVKTSWLVAGKVKNLHSETVKGATVTVAPTIAVAVRSLSTDAEGRFRTEYQLNASGIDRFNVVLTVRKKGYQTAHAYISYQRSAQTWEVPITVREPVEDPSLLSSSDLISGLAPRLKQLGPADRLSGKDEKEYTRGVADFFDRNRPESAIPAFTKVAQNNPGCIGCRTMMALAELGWNDLDDGSRALAEGVNAVLADRANGRPEPLVAYGTWLNWQHEPDKAEPFFREALKYTSQDPLALQELGRTQLAQRKYENASDDLKTALAAGAGPAARLLYVQALVGADRPDDALTEMNRYLDGRDVKKMPIQVRQVWTSVRNRQQVKTLYAAEKSAKDKDDVDFLKHPPAALIQGLEPAKDQSELTAILDGAGAKIQELLKNFPNTISLEAVQQEKLGHKGEVSRAQKQKFRYLCVVPRETWGPGFLEYRADLNGNAVAPKGLSEGFMLTQGFNSTALFLHPSYRAESAFQYLGRQSVNGRGTRVLAFQQIPEKAHLTGNFRKGETSFTTFSQGLVWIDAVTSQILRIHTELLAPLPELRLDKQTMDVDFHEVHFAHLNQTLWLPEQVLVSLDWNSKRLRNRHAYSDYQVFDVDASEKIAQPKGVSESSSSPPDAVTTK